MATEPSMGARVVCIEAKPKEKEERREEEGREEEGREEERKPKKTRTRPFFCPGMIIPRRSLRDHVGKRKASRLDRN